MSLVAQLSALATRIGTEIKGLIRPDHPGLARAWVNFGYVNGSVQLRAAAKRIVLVAVLLRPVATQQ